MKGRKVAVILYSYYPFDPRPRRAAEAMAEAGAEVDLLCLSEATSDLKDEEVNGVHVRRTPLKRRRGGKWTYFQQYGRFFVLAFWFLSTRGLRRRKYDLVHVHNMPDFLVFAALVPKLRGARIILDLHDPMPELMSTIYDLDPNRWPVRLLRGLERLSIGFANMALTPNLAFKRLFESRSTRNPEKIQIIMNSPQQELFDPDRKTAEEARDTSAEGEFRLMHHGSIVHRHGVDLLVEAVARVRPELPRVSLDIYGAETPFVHEVMQKAAALQIADCVHYHGAKNQREIAAAIQRCDLGIVPNRRSIFTEINFPTRLFEYLAMHRPVIAPSTAGIRDYFDDEQLLYFEPGDVASLADRILWVHRHREEAREIARRGADVYRHHLWSEEKVALVQLASRLMSRV